MSKEIDERVVQMKFDNEQFEVNVKTTMSSLDKLKTYLNFDGAERSFEYVSRAANNVNLSKISESVEALQKRFSTLGIIQKRVIENLTDLTMNFVGRVNRFVTSGIKSGGISRAMNLENAHFKLQGLIKDEKKVAAVMDNVSESVDGTAYSLDAAATVASQLAGSGMEAGDKLLGSLKAVAGVAAMTGSSYEDIGNIFTTVASNGRLMGDQLNQLAARGMNTTATLGKYLNKSESDVRKMVSKGEISFQTFSEAMNDAFGEQAGKANETLSGALSNVRSALARIGAAFVSPLVEQNGPLVQLLNAIRVKVNDIKNAILPFAEKATTIINNFVSKVTALVSNIDINNILKGLSFKSKSQEMKELTDKVAKAQASFDKASSSAKNLGKAVNDIVAGKYGNGQERFDKLSKAGINYYEVQNKVNKALGNNYRYTEKQIKSQNKLLGITNKSTKATNKLTNAQLKKAGLTDEEIKQYREIEEAAKKAGMPVNDYINSTESMSTKSLIGKTLSNLVNILKQVGKAAKTAWSLVFPSSLTSMGGSIHSVFVAFANATASMTDFGDQTENLQKTFQGLFVIIDILRTVIVGPLSLGFKIVSRVLKAFDLNILDVTAKISDVIVKVRDWIKEHDLLTKGIDKAAEAIKPMINKTKDWLGSLKKMPEFTKMMTDFINAMKSVGDRSKAVFKGVSDLLVPLFDSLGKAKSLGDVTKSLKEFGSSVKELTIDKFTGSFKDLGNSVTNFSKVTKNGLEDTESFLGKFYKKVKMVLDKIKPAFENVGIGEVLTTAFGFGMIKTLSKFGKVLEKIASPFDAISGVLGSVKGVLGSVSGTLEVFQKQIKAEALKTTAVALAILAGSIVVLALIPVDKLWNAVFAIAAVAGVLYLLSKGLSNMSLIEGFKVGPIVAVMIGLAEGVFVLSKAIRELSGMDWDDFMSAMGMLTIMITALVGFTAILSKLAPELSTGAGALIALSAALYVMTKALEELVNIAPMAKGSMEEIVSMLAMMVISLGVLSAVSAIGGIAGGLGMIAIAGALFIMVSVIKQITKLSESDIERGTQVIGGIMEIFVMIMAFSKLAGRNSDKAGVGILAMSAGVLLMVGAIKLLSMMKQSEIDKGMDAIKSIMKVFALVIASTALAGDNAAKAGITILAMAGALIAIATVIVILSHIKKGLGQAVAAISAIMGMFALVIMSTKLASSSKGTIIALAVSMGLLVSAIGGLAMIPKEKLQNAVAALSIVMGAFALVIASTKLAGESYKSLIVVLACVAGLAVIIGVLANFTDPTAALASAGAIAILLTTMAGVLILLNFVEPQASAALVPLATMLLVVGGIALIIGVLNSYHPDQALEIAKALSLVLVTMAGALLICTVIGAASPAAIAGMILFAVFVAEIGAILYKLGSLKSDVADAIQNGIPLLELLASALGGALGAFVGAFAASVSNALPTIGQNLSDFMSNAKGFFTGIKGIDKDSAEAADAMASVIMKLSAASIIDGLSRLFGLGDISSLGTTLESFGEAVKKYGNSVAGANTKAINDSIKASKSVVEIINSLPRSGGWLQKVIGEKDAKKFGKGLKTFGAGVKDFGDAVNGINSEAIENATGPIETIVEMANSIPKEAGLFAIFTGKKDMKTFSENLTLFGESLAQYSQSVAAIDSTGASAGANIVNGISSAIENSSSTLENSLQTTLSTTLSGFDGYSDRFKTIGSSMAKGLADGLKEAKDKIEKSIKSSMNNAVSTARGYINNFYTAGSYLVEGFADGITVKTFLAEAKARKMAKKAHEAASKELDEHSPSKVMRKIGEYAGEGFVIGLETYVNRAGDVGSDLASSSVDGLNNAMNEVRDYFNSDMDIDTTIRPVVDLSNVKDSVSDINSMLSSSNMLTMNANIGAISASMANRQNGTGNDDVINAINRLGTKISNMPANTYNVNGITYDDGSNVSNAVSQLIRATQLERRI